MAEGKTKIASLGLTVCTVKDPRKKCHAEKKKTLQQEKKKSQEEPQKREPLSQDTRTWNRYHMYQKEQQNQSFQTVKQLVGLQRVKSSSPNTKVSCFSHYWRRSRIHIQSLDDAECSRQTPISVPETNNDHLADIYQQKIEICSYKVRAIAIY